MIALKSSNPIRDRLAWLVAYLLPRRVVYLAAVRLWADVTSGKQYGRTDPAHLKFADALKRYELLFARERR